MLFPFDAEELAVEEMRRRSSKPSPGSHTGLTPVAAPSDAKAGVLADAGAAAALSAGPPAQPLAAAGQAKAAAAKPPREGGRRWLIPVLATIVLVLLLAGGFLNFIYFKRVVNLPAARPAEVARGEIKVPLGLAVERRGNDLRVSWNGSAPLIAKADFGMLLIRGTSVSRDVPLTADELRSGSVMYSSPADQVRFQLNVVSGEQVAREFLTVLMPVAADGRPAPGDQQKRHSPLPPRRRPLVRRYPSANSGNSSQWKSRARPRPRPSTSLSLPAFPPRLR